MDYKMPVNHGESKKWNTAMGQWDHLYHPDRDRTADKTQLQHTIIIIVIISTTVNNLTLGNHSVSQTLQEVSLTTILQISKVPTNYNTYFRCSRNLRNSSRIQVISAAHEDQHTNSSTVNDNRTHS